MEHATTTSFAFAVGAGVLSLLMLALAVRGFRHERTPHLMAIAAAFTLFALKSFFVGYAILTDLVEHHTLELMDTIGDLATVFLFALPIILPRKPNEVIR